MCNPFCVLKPIGLGAQSGNLAFRLGEILSLNFGCRVGVQIANPSAKKHSADGFVVKGVVS